MTSHVPGPWEDPRALECTSRCSRELTALQTERGQIHIKIAETTSGESATTVTRRKPPGLFKVADGAG